MGIGRGKTVPSFNLVDARGNPITKVQLLGKWTLMFFGYTHCPDYCPMTLMTLANVYRHCEQADPALAHRIQVVFVSLDPYRDTSEILADYLAYFHPLFIGATGEPAELKRFTKFMGINYTYTDTGTGKIISDASQRPSHDYTVDHSANVYVFNERAVLFSELSPPITPERVDALFEKIRAEMATK